MHLPERIVEKRHHFRTQERAARKIPSCLAEYEPSLGIEQINVGEGNVVSVMTLSQIRGHKEV